MSNANKVAEFKALMEKMHALKAEIDSGSCKERIELESGQALTIKVSEKGGVSVYGIQRFPVTLFANQWESLLEAAPALLDYINRNRDKLATKKVA